MNEPIQPPFLKFLEAGVDRGGFETDDVLSALVPLMKQTLATHRAGQVAPLNGIADLSLSAEGHLTFAPDKAAPPQKNASKVEAIQSPQSRAMDIVAEARITADIDQSSLKVSDLGVNKDDSAITKPMFLPDYRSWEQAVGHHDELTDIFSLGMLLASVACGLDFTDPDELETFTVNRTNLFGVNHRLNPVVASVIVQMTELNRHKRAPDLAQMISRLEHYRDQAAELNFNRLDGFKESGPAGKRRMIQTHLRDRLFEISRRNRLIYFQQTLQTLNLTVASVPIMLDYRNIKLEQLFVWHTELATAITEGTAMALGKYLRFEDAPYIPGVLDKIISEARRDRAEFGFSQLRLVLCFLRWNNLKEAKDERIHSPLLLLPVELTKKKGVRDNYVLSPTTTEAEINPALRHYLKELYGLNLPEFWDLKESTLDQLYDSLKTLIQSSEPGVTLNKIDRPQIELIHEKARQRVDQYRRRMKISARRERAAAKPEYSYDRENFHPLGLQLFLSKVRPTPMPMRNAAGAASQPQPHYIVEPNAASPSPDQTGLADREAAAPLAISPAIGSPVLETERRMFALRGGNNQNPYSWDFDLCSLTLGNFNYRKMTLVRDYTRLIETDMASGAFDGVFSLAPKPTEETPPPLELSDLHLVIPCDATQASAISRARSGASYIIQGPPGTGKSQTITNLIADYVARGKRVLFVCEKRAAIDVVFHRLRQQGLDELCCLIHDSQTDKKAFIQNLKQTYDKFLAPDDPDADVDTRCQTTLKAMELELAALRRFSDVMQQKHFHTGIAVRSLLRRLVELRGRARELPLQVEDVLPEYPLWLQHGDVVNRLQAALADLGEELCFAKHPLRWLGKGVLEADRPIETLSALLDQAEDLLDAVENGLELSGLNRELWNTLEQIRIILEFAVRAKPLADRNLFGILNDSAVTAAFDELCGLLDSKAHWLELARQKTTAWREPLSPDDTQNALAQAQAFEKSIFRFLQPAFWRLKKTLQSRYDFTQHAVAPSWSKILKDLMAQHEAQATLDALNHQACQQWQTESAQSFRTLVAELRTDKIATHPAVAALVKQVRASAETRTLIENLAGIHEQFLKLDTTLGSLLAEHEQFDFQELVELLAKLREQAGVLAELSPILVEFVELPDALSHALRRADVPLGEFEGAIGHKSINQVYREDRAINRFEGRILARKMDQLEKHYRDWLGLNGRRIRAAVRRKFLEHVNISSLPASQLEAEQKGFKKCYAAGRRELEHEFAKTMRYKSIRDLAANNTGQVIRDLKPIWLMSPLSVSDALPLDPDLFDVVIFDEASQVPLEEAIPAIYRSHQAIVVGDEMQLPPTTFFTSARGEDESIVVEEQGERIEMDLDSDSFLTQSAQNLPSTMLAWHYRSRYEALISFSNAAFYSGNLFTIPDRQRALDNQTEIQVTAAEQGEANVEALLARSISFHFMEHGVYQDRTNPAEATYIAHLVRGLLAREGHLSMGIVAFSEAQQSEIEGALGVLAAEDSDFAARLETEYAREENGVFCGLIVKNLENIQGDERDIIIMSVCYGHDAGGRMLMNFGPINQRGGEKRLNVIFSRAKHHMALVSSIRYSEITNDYNDGANSLKNFLQYAEAVSKGDAAAARRVLENLNPLSRKALAPLNQGDAVVHALAKALETRGHSVDLNVGQSRFRCDLAVRSNGDSFYQLGVLVDTDSHYANPNLLDRYLMQPAILRAFGWRFALILTKDWYHNPDDVLSRLEKLLQGVNPAEDVKPEDEELVAPVPPPAQPRPGPGSTPPAPESAEPTTTKPNEPINSAPAKPASAAGSTRHFEFVGGSSRKYWEISMSGNSFTVRFGRIGTPGQSQTKAFADETKAKNEAAALIAEKLKKGYVEKT
ncbi:MAG TPA: AAA domain-containing protein [Alphaproteobacteria bacterium]|nr:AAA domain-containing protein [Alphaproteobacteria bacterium]